MPLDRILFIKIYLNRLVNTLVPSELGAEYTKSLVDELLLHLTSQVGASPSPNLSKSLDQIETFLLAQNRRRDWHRFKEIVERLIKEKSPDQVAKYLVFLTEFMNEPSTKRTHPLGVFDSSSHTILDSRNSPRRSTPEYAPNFQPMARLLEPFRNSLSEAQIIPYLQYTLLGQDTQLLAFRGEAIEIPPTIDNNHARILSDILEPALIFRQLSKFSADWKGAATSPIKVSFYRSVDSIINNYAGFVNQLFQSYPQSLIAILHSLKQETITLRAALYLLRQSLVLDGHAFLTKVYTLSKFGDIHVQELAAGIFNNIVVPYYEYFEQWIVRGELIDEHTDFFVSFNASENHINDIVTYNPKKLPTFLNADPVTFTKALQIGKTLIFLSKYCKELEWVNNYSAKYSQIIFEANAGLRSMPSSSIVQLINSQYETLINYLTVVVEGKYLVYLHLLNLKSIMLMGNSDFIEVVKQKGSKIFGEPAMSLTSGRLSDLLVQSIEASTIRTFPLDYLNRIDARILDLSHGSIGWDVFTLEYKLLELPVETLLNYDNASTQYLRLFHFLWSLRHYQFLLNENFLEYQSLQRNDLKILSSRSSDREHSRVSQRKNNAWFLKAVRTINIVRSRLLAVIRVILRYISFDMIEELFNEKVVRSLFKAKSVLGAKINKFTKSQPLPILNKAFANKVQNSSTAEKDSLSMLNMNECTIDDITGIHADYLESISRCKLLNEDVKGHATGSSYIDQIFEFLDMAFSFVKSSEEFSASLVNYLNIVSVSRGVNSEAEHDVSTDADLSQLQQRLRGLLKIMYLDIYIGRFEPKLNMFLRDLRSDVDLKELSKLL